MSTLGNNVRAWRERLGWTQPELSQRSGVLQSIISDLESGKQRNIRSDKLAQLATAFGIPVDQLLRGEDVGAQPTVPAEAGAPGLHPLVIEAGRRFGPDLDEADWRMIAGYIQGVAEKSRMRRAWSPAAGAAPADPGPPVPQEAAPGTAREPPAP